MAVPAKKLPIALSFALVDDAGDGQPQAPSEFRIFRGGQNTSTKGPFLFDDQAADAVMAYFAKRGLVPKMDYEHQSVNAPKNGQPAPNSAFAWTPQVRRGEDGQPELWATNVKWTDRARQMIESREYSYFSPLFQTDDDDRVTEVWNLALTNLPALDNIEELIAATAVAAADRKDSPMKTKCMKCSKGLEITDDKDSDDVACAACMKAASAKSAHALSVAVGLKPDSDEVVALGAVQSMVATRDELIALTGAENFTAAIGVARAWKESHARVTALTAEIETGKQKARNKEFGDLLDKGVTEKKMTAAFRADYWEKTHAPGGNATEAGLVQLRAFIGTAPVSVGGPDVKPPKTGPGPLPASQMAMAKEMGMSPERLERFQKDREAQIQTGG